MRRSLKLPTERARTRYVLRLMPLFGISVNSAAPDEVVRTSLESARKEAVESLLRYVGRSNQDLLQYLSWQMGPQHLWHNRYIEFLRRWIARGVFFELEARTVAAH